MTSARVTLALLLLFHAPLLLAADKRPLQVSDLDRLQELGDPELSPDGRFVAYEVESVDVLKDEAQSDLWMSPLDGGEAVRLTSSPQTETRPRFSPDGRYLAFLAKRGDDKHKQVYLLDRRGGEATRLTAAKADVEQLAFSPDSARLLLAISDPDPDDDATATNEQQDGDKPAKQPIVITRRQFKRDGEGFLSELRQHLYVFDLKTRELLQITSGPYDDSDASWSPDGQSVAFVSNRTADPDSNQDSDIFLVRAKAGETPVKLSTSPGSDVAPAFSPDGRFVAFTQGCDPKDLWYGPTTIGLVPSAGGPTRTLTASLDRLASSPRFAPDGKSVLFLLEDRGTSQLARVDIGTGRIERVAEGELDIQGYDVGPKGELVVRESRPQQPFELSLVGPRGLTRLTHANDAWLSGIELGQVERLAAQSADGTQVDGFLILPPGYKPGQRVPTILRIHGGPAAQNSAAFEFEWQVLAAHGYAVVAPNPRGSTGYGLAFARAIWADWGNKDYADVLAAVDAAVARGVADGARLGVGGWSYGGILTNYVITKTTRFKAAISGASESNYFANYGHDHYQYEWETELGLPWRKPSLWLELSPWFQVDQVKTPTLVMCGQEDWNVPLVNSEQLYQALKRLGVQTELVIYPGEDHSIGRPSYRRDRYERYVAWYDKYVKPSGADGR